MWIDCHVHCRDEEQEKKETIKHALQVAQASGLDAIFDMPNTEIPVTTRQRAIQRMELAEKANSPVFYGTYIGVTANPKQIQEAVETVREFFPESPEDKTGIIGLKMFAGKSVGDLAIINNLEQMRVYQELATLNYQGVLVVHCEKETEMRPDFWNPSKPWTHSDARPEEAEIQSIQEQITHAVISNYQGRLHIAHVSTSDSVKLVRDHKDILKITCGVTPHHLLLNNIIMKQKNGILYKVNPPLREPETREELFKLFKSGQIDVLESDHAPHTLEQKTNHPYMSGIPNLASWPRVIEILQTRDISEELLGRMTHDNINRIFGTQIQRTETLTRGWAHLEDYAFNPYEHFKD